MSSLLQFSWHLTFMPPGARAIFMVTYYKSRHYLQRGGWGGVGYEKDGERRNKIYPIRHVLAAASTCLWDIFCFASLRFLLLHLPPPRCKWCLDL